MSQRPVIGDTYTINYVNSNGCTGKKTYNVSSINDNFAWITYPADGSVITDIQPTFTWQPASNTKSYGLVLTDELNNWLWTTQSIPSNTTSAICEISLAPGNKYVLYLHAYDANGNQATTYSHFCTAPYKEEECWK